MTGIVAQNEPVALIGGAGFSVADLQLAKRHAKTLVAADSGADRLLSQGVIPDAVIGDMDSLSAGAAAALADRLHPVDEQDTTDFDKALRSIDAPLVLAFGVTGGLFDHELAVMHSLLRHPARRCVVVGAETLVFLCPPQFVLDLPAGTRLSLFPFDEVRVQSTGLRWSTQGLRFHPMSRIGTSNEVSGLVELIADKPAMLTILPREALGAVIGAMVVAPRWP